MVERRRPYNRNPKPACPKDLLTKKEACALLGVSTSSFEKKQTKGEIAPICRYNGKNMYGGGDIVALKLRMTTQF